jgi:hypothetical protein
MQPNDAVWAVPPSGHLPVPPSGNPDIHVIKCPHCDALILVRHSDIACAIFRHGAFKREDGGVGDQIPPHSTKEECDDWAETGKIWGCGKPYKFDGEKVEVCEYI